MAKQTSKALNETKKNSALNFKLISAKDKIAIQESRKRTEIRATRLIEQIKNPLLKESAVRAQLNERLLDEAVKMERLIIMEAISDSSFHDLKQQFQSLLGAVGHIIGDFDGSDLADALYDLRNEGLELLNELVEYLMDLEDGYSGNGEKEKPQLDPHLKQVRNSFVQVFTDISVIMRGLINLSDKLTQEEGYNDLMGVLASIKRTGAGEKPLMQALRDYDKSMGVKQPRRGGNLLSKIFGKEGPKGLLAKFQKEVVTALKSSPGFGKLVNTSDMLNYMLRQKSVDQLILTFKTMEHIIAKEVDTDFLLKMTQSPKGVWNTIKSFIGGLGGHGGATIGGGGIGHG